MHVRIYQRIPKLKNSVLLVAILCFTNCNHVFAKVNCDSIKNEIKESARRHVNSNSPMQASVLTEAYKDMGCMSVGEIVTLYETEYAQFKKKKENVFQNLIPNMGWVAFLLLALIFGFKELLKKGIEKLYDWICTVIYNNLFRIKLVSKFAIKSYKKSLVDKYSKIKIPFRPNKPLLMQDIYIPLKLVNGESYKTTDVLEAIKEFKKTVIVGPPGSGKSMLCKYIMYSFGQEKVLSQKLPVIIELNRLNSTSQDILNLIIDELNKNCFPNAKKNAAYCLRKKKFYLLFDGFDEVIASERNNVAKKIIDFIELNHCEDYLITSRNAVYKNEFEDIVDQTLTLAEFNSHQIRQFLEAWEEDMDESKSIDQLMTILQDTPQIMSLAINPLILTIIAYLYADTNHVLPHSRGEFYLLATDVLLNQWHNERNLYDAASKGLILQSIALANQDAEERIHSDRKLIKNTDLVALLVQITPKLGLQLTDCKKIVDEIVERSGLLLIVDGGEYYQFAHLTMQEFYAAKQLRDDKDGILKRFAASRDTWRESVKLWCGLSNDATAMIKQVFEIDKMVAFECIAEAKIIQTEDADFILEHFILSYSEPYFEATRLNQAFGLVASDKRNRGSKVFAFLRDILVSPSSEDDFKFAVNSLSYTFLRKAADELIRYFPNDTALIGQALVKMGDIATPTIDRYISATGDWRACDFLAQIGTPAAIHALVLFLWSNNKQVDVFAALCLGEMLKSRAVEEVLEKVSVTTIMKKAGYVDWVWRPFKKATDNNINVITGRIVHILFYDGPQLKELDMGKLGQLDFRMGFPLLILTPSPAYYRAKFREESVRKDQKLSDELISIDESRTTKNVLSLAKNNLDGNRLTIALYFAVNVLSKQTLTLLLMTNDNWWPKVEDWVKLSQGPKSNYLGKPRLVLMVFLLVQVLTQVIFSLEHEIGPRYLILSFAVPMIVSTSLAYMVAVIRYRVMRPPGEASFMADVWYALYKFLAVRFRFFPTKINEYLIQELGSWIAICLITASWMKYYFVGFDKSLLFFSSLGFVMFSIGAYILFKMKKKAQNRLRSILSDELKEEKYTIINLPF